MQWEMCGGRDMVGGIWWEGCDGSCVVGVRWEGVVGGSVCS